MLHNKTTVDKKVSISKLFSLNIINIITNNLIQAFTILIRKIKHFLNCRWSTCRVSRSCRGSWMGEEEGNDKCCVTGRGADLCYRLATVVTRERRDRKKCSFCVM